MLVTDPAIRRAARELLGPGAYITYETISKFEQAYRCKIQRTSGNSGLIPTVKFYTEQDEVLFLLRWK